MRGKREWINRIRNDQSRKTFWSGEIREQTTPSHFFARSMKSAVVRGEESMIFTQKLSMTSEIGFSCSVSPEEEVVSEEEEDV